MTRKALHVAATVYKRGFQAVVVGNAKDVDCRATEERCAVIYLLLLVCVVVRVCVGCVASSSMTVLAYVCTTEHCTCGKWCGVLVARTCLCQPAAFFVYARMIELVPVGRCDVWCSSLLPC